MAVTMLAEFLAGHALVLLAVAMVLVAIAVGITVTVVRAAARYSALLWRAADIVVPGELRRPLTYLALHLALGLILSASVVVFVEIAENVLSGRQIAAFDVAFARALAAQTTPAWHSIFWYLTWMGSGFAVMAIGVVVLWRLLANEHRLLAIMWAVSQTGAAVLNAAMKAMFARPRPDGADPVLYSSGWSFPSGHAMSTIVLCGVGVYLVVRLSPRWRVRGAFIALLLVWPIVIGFSRLYLGVHYASDVIAGYLAGLAWIAVCVSSVEVALSRRTPAPRGPRAMRRRGDPAAE